MAERNKVIAIFDIGKTNKKIFLWNEDYQIVFERQENFDEILDDEGFLGEDIQAVQAWVKQTFSEVCALPEFEVKALNFSAYGATVVFVDSQGASVGPLYNYLKPFPDDLFAYANYGGQAEFARATASPILGNLNSGLQAFRVMKTQPEKWKNVAWVLHWPNFLASLFTHELGTEITSIGCHTALWDFDKQNYHAWVQDSGLLEKLPKILPVQTRFYSQNQPNAIPVGLGLHDSSSALVPYLKAIDSDFVLVSTGTWCISMHPFSQQALTAVELENDVLCFMQFNGNPVKAARLFAGNTHEIQLKRMNAHFKSEPKAYQQFQFSPAYVAKLDEALAQNPSVAEAHADFINVCRFDARDLNEFTSLEEAYVQLMVDIMCQQIYSLQLLLHNSPVGKIVVDGGFSKNPLYMNFLVHAFPGVAIFGAEVAQASSLGAALVMHEAWNSKQIPSDLVKIKKF
jgi:sugar (pentulose or hexulose) kinase